MLSLGVWPERKDPGIKQMKIDIMDTPNDHILPHLDSAVDFIAQALQSGGRILVHCFAGVSRSSSCVIAYLIREKKMVFFNALYYVRNKRSVVHPNLAFAK